MTTPLAILRNMQAKYARLESYRDTGTVTKSWIDGDTSKITFLTAFRRPFFFRFEWKHFFRDRSGVDKSSHSAIWCNGAKAYSCDAGERPVLEESLELAIAKATGVSFGAVHAVSAMLMTNVGGFLLAELERLTAAEDTLSTMQCYRIEGIHPDGWEYEVFVDKRDLLLRQVTDTSMDGVVSRETRDEIRLNEPIDETVFENGWARP
jgi:hypothetical protein